MFRSSRARLVPGSLSSDLAGATASALTSSSAVKTYRMDWLQLYELMSQQHAGALVPASVGVFPATGGSAERNCGGRTAMAPAVLRPGCKTQIIVPLGFRSAARPRKPGSGQQGSGQYGATKGPCG